MRQSLSKNKVSKWSRRAFFVSLILAQPCLACSETKAFTDHSLTDWLNVHAKGLILVVSDGMPYSESSVDSVQIAAQKKKLSLLVLSDHKGKQQEVRCDPLLASNELFSRGALRHFPSLFFIKNHLLLPVVIPGIQSQKELELNLNAIFHR